MDSGYIGNLFLCSLITMLFAILVFIINISFKNSNFYVKHLAKYKIVTIIVDLLFGVILSASYLMTFYLAQPNYDVNGIMVLMVILPGVMFVGPYFALGGISGLLIPTFMYMPSTPILIYLLVSYGLYLLCAIFNYYVLKKLSSSIKTLITHGLFLLLQISLVLVLTLASNMNFNHDEMWVSTTIVQVFILLSWVTFIYINKIYKKTQNMNIQLAHDFKNFVVADYAYYAINEFIKVHNVQYAYVIGFSLKNITNTSYNVGQRTVNTIKWKIADAIYEKYHTDDALFFISDEGHLFAMIKTNNQVAKNLTGSYRGNYACERNKDDVFYTFQEFGKKIQTHSILDIKIKPRINLMIGIYGIHNNDLHDLVQNVEMLMDWYEPNVNDNIVHIFNPMKEFSSLQDMTQYQQLCAIFDVKTIKLQFHEINYNNETIIIPTYSAFNLAAFNAQKIMETVPFNLRPILLKHLSAKAIQSFSTMNQINTKLLIKYPIESLMYENFSSQMFYSKLTKFNISPKNILILLNLDYLQTNHAIIINNINNLKKLGVGIVCTNVTVQNIDFVRDIKPYFVFYKRYAKLTTKEHEYEKLMTKLLAKIKVKYYAN